MSQGKISLRRWDGVVQDAGFQNREGDEGRSMPFLSMVAGQSSARW